MTEPLCEVFQVDAGYGARRVLRQVSLELRPGELLGVIGPNGCGKSTLLRVFAGLLRPESGEARLEGRPLPQWPRREIARRIAVAPQSQTPLFSFTAREVVEMGRSPWQSGWGSASKEDQRIAKEAMERCDLRGFEDRPVDELSGGELQRVSIARAMAQTTPALLLDEPTAHLDLGHQIAIFQLMRQMAHRSNIAVLCVSHDLHLAPEYCDRLALMRDGQVIAAGTPRETITVDNLRALYGVTVEVRDNPRSGQPLVLTPGVEREEAV